MAELARHPVDLIPLPKRPAPHHGLGIRGGPFGATSQTGLRSEIRFERKERVFFEELAATANVMRAAKAAGVSPNAVYARRMKHPLFRAKWEAVLETGRAAIEMKLVEAANKSFDPNELDAGEVEPRVSVAEAIRIVQAHRSKT